MAFAICIVTVSSMRAEPSHRSEMVSQLLLGEGGFVLEETKDFVKIKGLHDDYEGWCQQSQVGIVVSMPLVKENNIFIQDQLAAISVNDQPAFAPMGAPLVNDGSGGFTASPYKVRYAGAKGWNAGTAAFTAAALNERVKLLINTPYLWGGRSVFGIDCSGFTQLIFRFFNFRLLRDAYLQATQGEAIGFLQEGKCGDLAFFDNPEGKITHVGILLNDGEIIHASGKVRIDRIDNEGIINSDTGQRTHKLRVIKRVIS